MSNDLIVLSEWFNSFGPLWKKEKKIKSVKFLPQVRYGTSNRFYNNPSYIWIYLKNYKLVTSRTGRMNMWSQIFDIFVVRMCVCVCFSVYWWISPCRRCLCNGETCRAQYYEDYYRRKIRWFINISLSEYINFNLQWLFNSSFDLCLHVESKSTPKYLISLTWYIYYLAT